MTKRNKNERSIQSYGGLVYDCSEDTGVGGGIENSMDQKTESKNRPTQICSTGF